MKKTLLIGYYGWNNTGDDIMLYSLLRLLSRLNPNQKFSVLSQKMDVVVPDNINVNFISPVDKIGFFSEIVTSSTVVLGGGTHLYDYGRKINRIVRLTQFYLISLVCKTLSIDFYLIGIGVERPTTKWGKFLIYRTCKNSKGLSVRDSESYQLLLSWGLEKKTTLSFDLSASLDFPPVCRQHSSRGMVLGLSILPFFKIYYDDEEKDLAVLHRIVEAANVWLDHDMENEVWIFIVKGESLDDDYLYSNKLPRLMTCPSRVKVIPYSKNPLDMYNNIAKCDAFVGMRYHACMMSYLACKPQIIISYARKNDALAQDIRLPECALLSMDELLDGGLEGAVGHLIAKPDDFIGKTSQEEIKKMANHSCDCMQLCEDI